MNISVITPTFNCISTIRRTIESIIANADYIDQYIIIDGFSTDGTIDLIQSVLPELEQKIKQVIFVSEKDGGLYYALNKGIRMAMGDIVGIINSDDWYNENTISKVLEEFKDNAVDIVHGELNYFLNNVFIRSEGIHHRFLPQKMIPHPTCFVRRRVYERLGLFNEKDYKLAADYDFMLRCYVADINFKMIHEKLANFSMGGITDQGFLSKIETIKIQRRYKFISFKKFLSKRMEYAIKSFLKKF